MTWRKIEILKCHGSSNDFVMVDERAAPLFAEAERARFSTLVCDRSGPLGADGVLFCLDASGFDGRMRMFNPDGSEAETCGNGLRCVGRLVLDSTGRQSVTIATMRGSNRIARAGELARNVPAFSASIGPISTAADALPIRAGTERVFAARLPQISDTLSFYAVAVPNPHLVAIVPEVVQAQLLEVGRRANVPSALLPKRANVTFCSILGPQAIYTATYERGAGLTLSCGSGMASAALVARLSGACPGSAITVYNSGGMVLCDVAGDGEDISVQQTGNATVTFRAGLAVNLEEMRVSPEMRKAPEFDEAAAYEQFLHGIRTMLREKHRITLLEAAGL